MDFGNGELNSLDKLIMSLNAENIQGDIQLAKTLISQKNEMEHEMETNKKQVEAIVQSMNQQIQKIGNILNILYCLFMASLLLSTNKTLSPICATRKRIGNKKNEYYIFFLTLPVSSNSVFSNSFFIKLLIKLKKVNTRYY